MKFKTTEVGGTVEILAADDFDAIPFTVTETGPVKAGTPMTMVRGVIDQKKAEAHSGVTYDAAALKTAVPGIVLRDNIGVNAADTE